MSQHHALSDEQVGKELLKMTSFIKEEAEEKAHEITIKANEEFSIEKAKLVQQAKDAIDDMFTKMFTAAAMSQSITQSTMANKTRLNVLGAQEDLVDHIFLEAENKLAEGSSDKASYEGLLKALIIEAILAMDELDVQIRARKADYPLVKKAIEAVVKEFKDKTGKNIKATIDEKNPVPEGCAGGIIVVGGNGFIDINNTFETRLALLRDSAMPTMRKTLFGLNSNRKFFD
ncbi:ATPase, V1/A1 complex, subunit E [Bombardia bombarda]|uniref:ATPase, V1/A1 complex, subunit E n=1 Tax=Bombardia bombarda TaxID=252184 RepID=A0AA39WI13_9PEZI|nr:ATPase, V1/A1 complex, subunit E [Bombardia bombarda]